MFGLALVSSAVVFCAFDSLVYESFERATSGSRGSSVTYTTVADYIANVFFVFFFKCSRIPCAEKQVAVVRFKGSPDEGGCKIFQASQRDTKGMKTTGVKNLIV